jgi:hypothetical protein
MTTSGSGRLEKAKGVGLSCAARFFERREALRAQHGIFTPDTFVLEACCEGCGETRYIERPLSYDTAFASALSWRAYWDGVARAINLVALAIPACSCGAALGEAQLCSAVGFTYGPLWERDLLAILSRGPSAWQAASFVQRGTLIVPVGAEELAGAFDSGSALCRMARVAETLEANPGKALRLYLLAIERTPRLAALPEVRRRLPAAD